MTGYLALLSNWKSKDIMRSVHRIFIFKKGQLENKLVGKLLSLHSYHGMKTYVFSKDKYDELFGIFNNDNNTVSTFRKKEVLVWDRPDDSSYSTFSIDDHTYNKTMCYQSFWEIDDEHDVRQNKDEYINYYDIPIKRDKIKIWFEFITYNKKHNKFIQISDDYLNFVKFLINKTVCCTERKHVKLNSINTNFGIEIKTMCKNCIKINTCEEAEPDEKFFEFVSNDEINNVLNEYTIY